MHDSGGFGSGNFLSRSLGVVSWCIIEMEGHILKRLPALAVAESRFDVRQNRCRKELRIPSGQARRL
jgi:hypothetical protein